ncbi:MAG: beta-N-acetylhexosaminidase [Burkholderiaceae bacterium]|jgi:beta-N-acetylhexosaminidase|nr:beta-N-acetylhexosaminidase [Burkholderiaceae bacterium]
MKASGLGPVVVDIAGTRLTPADRERLSHPLVGMVILFTRNYESPAQLAALTAEIHALRDPALVIAVDHEGGRVQRFRGPPFTRLPAMAELGALWERDVLQACRVATSAGFVLAAELRAFGVDLSFTPVLDLEWGRSGVIGNRAFARDPRNVAMLANHLCHGLQLAGMANCGKHFPGHGWAEADSHTAIPVDDRALDDILADDAAPYGWLGVSLASVMPAHVIYPQVDALPAGFSPRWIGEILRGRLGFTGAVFSDDLSMEGARVCGTAAESAQAAIDAGCDFVIVCNAEAADSILGSLAWRSSTAFEERLARLRPQATASPIEVLAATAMYRSARADLAALTAEPPTA